MDPSNNSNQQLSQSKPKSIPKRFVKNQIPDSILNNQSLNAAISLLPHNYNFEIHKCVWRIRSTGAKRVALQLPEGLLMYSLILSDIFSSFAHVTHCFILGDVTYGACCVDDLSAAALNADLLIHYGHSCLVPVDFTKIPCLYVFVEIKIDVNHLVDTVKLNIHNPNGVKIILAGTIQFASAIRAAKSELEGHGFTVMIPQSKPLSAGEVLGCTAPKVSFPEWESELECIVVFIADGRFHLEAFMIANPRIKAFRYDPYMGKLFLEEYDHKGMRETRKRAIEKAKEVTSWGIVLGTLGRQGNPRIMERLQEKMNEKGFDYIVVLMSEISPGRVALFEDSVDAWIQIACPRLSIDWGDAFGKPLLTAFEAEIALGLIPGWWERSLLVNSGCGKDNSCGGCANGNVKCCKDEVLGGDYPMDYYAKDGGDWNSSYAKLSCPVRRNVMGTVAGS
ncbi:2-(3-amino-3-carboxypropyl)histidine synthase subunit 1 [Mangifera indica]|uniref:2-(3-amino-3-carboxypropyl)histidine synthase subunit 1 n=1 Tax=Mangifera indica TaxID=29780 RepID=UPI001CFAEC6A|nr:2-(3-amino-3-carboxypropyl)histidine synthase subunit 1 [Mangifera indica]